MRKMVADVRDGAEKGLAEIIFDDGSSLEVEMRLVRAAGIHAGREIDTEQLIKRSKQDNYESCHEAALRFLESRARSEDEVRRHLALKKKFDEESVERTLRKLKEARLIDDNAFAEAWAKDRLTFKPRSRLMIQRELLMKGVDPETAEAATANVDDSESAFQAGLKKARLLRGCEYREFYKKLAGYLGRRGYGGEAVHGSVKRLWAHLNEDLSNK
jgi:regulatory protein